MEKVIQGVKEFINDEEGVTAIEYGLIAALISIAIIAGATVAGTSLNTLFTYIGNILKNATAAL